GNGSARLLELKRRQVYYCTTLASASDGCMYCPYWQELEQCLQATTNPRYLIQRCKGPSSITKRDTCSRRSNLIATSCKRNPIVPMPTTILGYYWWNRVRWN